MRPLSRVFFLFSLACSNVKREDSGRQIHDPETTSTVQKWKIDPNIGEKVLDMRAVINGFYQKSAETSDYREPGNTLNKHIEDIFSSCTMPSGPAHDTFHTYILQAIEYVKELHNEENNSPDSTLTKLEDHLAVFLEKFE
jgi:hypothetical protein